ncbi:hypothetical protein MA16_Dca000306 [Dendrobium catenatum]|uniref:Uncharacterized protein n=1 Tax=Dendrobium catenatum TaxID=906689 RepID=A0A2I0WTG8_9ASPA|nr:hypothetical protein MA16_Dca000306 [Dendrobium catenatum]
MMSLLCSHCMRVIRQLDIVNIPFKYLLLRWSVRARKIFMLVAFSRVWGIKTSRLRRGDIVV